MSRVTDSFGQVPDMLGYRWDVTKFHRDRDGQYRHCVRCRCRIPAYWLLCDGCKEYLAKAIAQAWADIAGGARVDDGSLRNLRRDEDLLWRALQAEGAWC